MNILSIDWDYFFPALYTEYDFGFVEENNNIYKTIAWIPRISAFNLFTQINILDEYKPDDIEKKVKNFLKNFNIKKNTKTFISDQHSDIYQYIDKNSTIYNFDAHHDLGYKKDNSLLTAENWGYFAIKEKKCSFIQIFPEEYKKTKISYIEKINEKIKVFYNVPEIIKNINFDFIFIARSSIFTPMWFDENFLFLIYDLQRNTNNVFCIDRSVLEIRYTYKEAKDFLFNLQKEQKERKICY